MRACHELSSLGVATGSRWPEVRMNLLCLGDKCWVTNVQKPSSILKIDCWPAEVEISVG